MSKLALPLIFITAVTATLFYVSQEEHGTGTLFLLASVLLVGQICATLPFIFEAKKRTGTPSSAPSNDVAAQKIIANQQIIHEDLRSLGETLIKRLSALSERQDATEKKLLAAQPKDAPDFSDDFDALLGKLNNGLDERFEKLGNDLDSLRESLHFEQKPDEKAHEKLDAIRWHLEEFLNAVENLAPKDDGAEEADDASDGSAVSDEDADVDAAFDELEQESENEENANEENTNDAVEDFPEDEDFFPTENDTRTAEEETAKQGEFELGDFPTARPATLVLEAMLGIENKPFLRGNAPGLSDNAGTPMTFVEIGKWSYDFSALTEDVTVRILRNDNENDPLGDPVTLAPGQTLELAYVP